MCNSFGAYQGSYVRTTASGKPLISCMNINYLHAKFAKRFRFRTTLHACRSRRKKNIRWKINCLRVHKTNILAICWKKGGRFYERWRAGNIDIKYWFLKMTMNSYSMLDVTYITDLSVFLNRMITKMFCVVVTPSWMNYLFLGRQMYRNAYLRDVNIFHATNQSIKWSSFIPYKLIDFFRRSVKCK